MTDNYELSLDEDIDIEDIEEDFPEKDRSRRAERRKNTWNKIRRVEDIAYRIVTFSPKTNEKLLGHRAAKRNPLKYYVCRRKNWRKRKTSEKNTLAREERVRDALREEEREAA